MHKMFSFFYIILFMFFINGCDFSNETERLEKDRINKTEISDENNNENEDSNNLLTENNSEKKISKYYKEDIVVNNNNYVFESKSPEVWEDYSFYIDDCCYLMKETSLGDLLNSGLEISNTEYTVSDNTLLIRDGLKKLDVNDFYNVKLCHKGNDYSKDIVYDIVYYNTDNSLNNNFISSIFIDGSDDNNRLSKKRPIIKIANGILLGSTYEDIVGVYGEPNYVYNENNYRILNYENQENTYKLILHVHYLDGLTKINIKIGKEAMD